MGVMKFRLIPPDLASRLPELKRAYVTGMDRTPGRSTVELRAGQMTVSRDTPESGRLNVPWPVAGFGTPVIATATLAERAKPYDLAIELARGKLNEVRNQTADWRQMGLVVPDEVEDALERARAAFARAVTSGDNLAEVATKSAISLEAACLASRLLVESYSEQLLKRRLDHSRPLPTLLACVPDMLPKAASPNPALAASFNAVKLRMKWSRVAPDEGKLRWDETEAQLQWAKKNKMTIAAGPLIEFRKEALPDWIWLWEGDYEEIQGQAVEYLRAAMTRFKGKVTTWHVAHRVASSEILGLSEEEQIRLAARLVQVARQIDPSAQVVVDFDRPWAEWMASGAFHLGPLHLADSLGRADLGMGGIGLEIAPGFSNPGSMMRDLLDFSRLLDLYSLVNLPIHIGIAIPSGASPDAKASAAIEPSQFPGPPDESFQAKWAASWVALATAKPFVRSVTWLQSEDSEPHTFAHAGLFRPDGSPKPVLDWLKTFRAATLA